jgi:hypothetical protein
MHPRKGDQRGTSNRRVGTGRRFCTLPVLQCCYAPYTPTHTDTSPPPRVQPVLQPVLHSRVELVEIAVIRCIQQVQPALQVPLPDRPGRVHRACVAWWQGVPSMAYWQVGCDLHVLWTHKTVCQMRAVQHAYSATCVQYNMCAVLNVECVKSALCVAPAPRRCASYFWQASKACAYSCIMGSLASATYACSCIVYTVYAYRVQVPAG